MEQQFLRWKLQSLSRMDQSRKGNLDPGVQHLVHYINSWPQYVTTSSCSGRIVLIDGDSEVQKLNCFWLFVSHDHCSAEQLMSGLSESSRDVVLKFEPFVLHVQCRKLEDAQLMHCVSVASGFRNSGMSVGKTGKIMTAVRSTHTLEVPLSLKGKLLVGREYIDFLVQVANQKMDENLRRIQRFQQNLQTALSSPGRQDLQTALSSPGRQDLQTALSSPGRQQVQTALSSPGCQDLQTVLSSPGCQDLQTALSSPGRQDLQTALSSPGCQDLQTALSSPGRQDLQTALSSPGCQDLQTALSSPGRQQVQTALSSPGHQNLQTALSSPGCQDLQLCSDVQEERKESDVYKRRRRRDRHQTDRCHGDGDDSVTELDGCLDLLLGNGSE